MQARAAQCLPCRVLPSFVAAGVSSTVSPAACASPGCGCDCCCCCTCCRSRLVPVPAISKHQLVCPLVCLQGNMLDSPVLSCCCLLSCGSPGTRNTISTSMPCATIAISRCCCCCCWGLCAAGSSGRPWGCFGGRAGCHVNILLLCYHTGGVVAPALGWRHCMAEHGTAHTAQQAA